MKSYEEMANDVLRRIEENETAQVRKRKNAARLGLSFGCVCIVVMLGITVWQSDIFSPPGIAPPGTAAGTEYDGDYIPIGDYTPIEGAELPPSADGEDSATSSAEDGQEPSGSRKKIIYINVIKNTVNPAPKYRDPALHYTEEWDDERMAEYLGIDLSALSAEELTGALPASGELPERGVLPKGVSYVESEHIVTFKKDGTLVEDRAVYSYKGGGKQLTILASRLGMPYDCLYTTETEKTTPYKNGNGEIVDVLVCADNDFEDAEDSTKWERFFVADFEYDGVFYRVKAENMLTTEFNWVIRGMIG